ncbi:MAG TPA: type III-B CRISPR module RAMP protein Cmr6 [Lentisphaeria bacterium]|nr:MAG: type III-B CRISPR module RAMP protein Cmr6 [Lentisphaerae bacterium GWF2_38_69]HBM15079.1 type III-B CRISPR module RAMP protein Cmr6 [Lentisphaeria bacterium]
MPIQTIKEVKAVLKESELSFSLRMSKFAKVGEKDAVSFIYEAKKVHFSCFSIPSSSSFEMKLGGRLIVNHAGGVLENSGLCIHRFFNYPMIPGSALKGIAGHAAWLKHQECSDEQEQRKLKEQIIKIFGSFGNETKSENAGTIAFLAAVPAKDDWKLVTDVLTPHGGNDYTNPVPSFFVAVEKGATFKFTLKKTSRAEADDLELAENWLKRGLTENGAGAKTAAGYGWFKEVTNG